MFEDTQTSEPMDTNEDIDIFADDDTDFPVEPTSEPEGEVADQQKEGQEQQTEETQQQETPFLDIVYNGQQMHLTKEQAITLAQKGQNYDKKMQENETLRQQLANSPERLMLQRMAQQSGIPYDQFLTQFQNQMKQSAVQVRAEQLMQTGVMDQQTAMRLAQAELEKEELLNQRSVEQNQRNQQRQQFEQQQRARQQAKEQFTREIAELVKEYPDFMKKYPTMESMPQIMQDAMRNGTSIKAAHQQVVIEEMRNEIAAYKQNEKNKAMSPGSASGVGSKNVDPFEAALFGDD